MVVWSMVVWSMVVWSMLVWSMVVGGWCLVLGAWCLVLGARCLVLGARCLVLGAWCLVLGACAWCLVLGAWCLVLGAWCLVLGAWCLVLGAWCLVLGAWCLVLGAWCLVLGAWCWCWCLVLGAWCLVVLGAWCLVLGAWCLVLGAWCLVLGAWCLVLGAWCLVLVDRGSKATLPLTIPCRVFKSSAKDSTYHPMGIALQGVLQGQYTLQGSPTARASGGQRPPTAAHVPYWWVNNPTLGEFCFTMIGRADIEGSKSNVAMNAWLPQASYPCGNFSDTSSFKFRRTKGSIGHAFTVRIRTGNQNQTSFYPFVPHEISVLVELILRTPALSFNRCAAPAKLPT
ncbi:hypothetical protein VNO77_47716 [Canavalia gladiata]|uniref:Senescence-associated protein n=1 Tax=Canavalia gladiata TaxID=3824 RepID=A0AAN9JGN0_CANGL